MHLRRMKMLEHTLGLFYYGHWKPSGPWAHRAPEEFHISSWLNYGLLGYDGVDMGDPCYTRTGCAMGIAAFTLEFQKEGFMMHERYNMPEYQDDLGFDAVARFLRIPVGEARYLFNGASYTDRTDLLAVLKRVSEAIQTEERKWQRTNPIIKRIYGWLHP